jgi:hypothetical protein
MSANREKTSSAMGIVLSVLLHGIFFAGCLALDASNLSSSSTTDHTSASIKQMDSQPQSVKPKS